jgi:phosphoribosylanthranilate isomerase
VRTKVKICGITRLEDARLALRLGADELGFVLAPSPRRVEPEEARAIVQALRGEAGIPAFRAIGVFVNEEARAMRDIIAFVGLDAAQIHGDEVPSACASLGFPWYRALRIGSAADAIGLVAAGWDCPRILVDAAAPGSYGGTGRAIGDWAALAARRVARRSGKEFFIAGGASAASVPSMIHSFAPDGIDASSGIEERPGRKSPERLEAFFAAIRGADAIRCADAIREADAVREGSMNAAR